MKNQIESSQNRLRMQFDNGLRVVAFVDSQNGGIISAAWVYNGRVCITEVRGRMGADAFADFLHETSTMSKKEIAKIS